MLGPYLDAAGLSMSKQREGASSCSFYTARIILNKTIIIFHLVIDTQSHNLELPKAHFRGRCRACLQVKPPETDLPIEEPSDNPAIRSCNITPSSVPGIQNLKHVFGERTTFARTWSECTVCLGSRNKSIPAHFSPLKTASDQNKLLE